MSVTLRFLYFLHVLLRFISDISKHSAKKRNNANNFCWSRYSRACNSNNTTKLLRARFLGLYKLIAIEFLEYWIVHLIHSTSLVCIFSLYVKLTMILCHRKNVKTATDTVLTNFLTIKALKFYSGALRSVELRERPCPSVLQFKKYSCDNVSMMTDKSCKDFEDFTIKLHGPVCTRWTEFITVKRLTI